jgi:hypothetical protein
VLYAFKATPGSPSSIVFDVQPFVRWMVTGTVRSAGSELPLAAFIFP